MRAALKPDWQAQKDGVIAFLAGLTLDDNPEPEGSPQAAAWAEGWRSARDADQEDPAWR